MRAVDTNVLVRLLMRDEQAQFDRVTAMFSAGGLCAMPTVILETEWVLRRVYRLRRAEVALGLRGLLRLPGLSVEPADVVALALDWFEQGMDFADALHLASARHWEGFATFDRDLIKIAARVGAKDVAEP
jgi:predicted nucleic-acid-binding protein